MQRRGVVLEEAALARGVGEVLGHRAGVPDQRAVAEDLHRPDPQPVVAEPGPDAEVEAERHPVAGVRRQRVQHVGGDHQLDPHRQPPLIARALVGRDLDRALPDPAAADAGLDDAGDALGQVDPPGPLDRVDQRVDGVGEDQPVEQLLGLLLEQPGRASARRR